MNLMKLNWQRFVRGLKGTRSLASIFTILAVTLGGSGCGDGPPRVSPNESQFDTTTLQEGYVFEVWDAAGTGSTPVMTVVGWGAETTWNDDLGIVWLSTHDTNKPLGTMTFTLTPDEGIDGDTLVIGFVASTTRVRVGTGPEIDGQFYAIRGEGLLSGFGCHEQDDYLEDLDELCNVIGPVIEFAEITPSQIVASFEVPVTNDDGENFVIIGKFVARR
jgi:hypothetical protein